MTKNYIVTFRYRDPNFQIDVILWIHETTDTWRIKSDGDEQVEENVAKETEENHEESIIYEDKESSLHVILPDFLRTLILRFSDWLVIHHWIVSMNQISNHG